MARGDAWFIGLFGARRTATRISIPLQYVGTLPITSVEVTVSGGENTVLEDDFRMNEIMPGDRFSVELRTSDSERHPVQLIFDVRAAGGVRRCLVVDVPSYGRPKVTEQAVD